MSEINIKITQKDLKQIIEKLQEIPGVTIKYKSHSSQKNSYERALDSESIVLISLTIILAGKVLPPTINAVRDVIIEHIKSKKKTIIIRQRNGSETIYVGPLKSNNDLERLNDDITKQLLSHK